MSRAGSADKPWIGAGGNRRTASGIAVAMTALVVPLLLCVLLAGPASARDSYAPAGNWGTGSFGPQGPARMALHEATNTLYVVDHSATPKRILKFDVSDPTSPQPANFSALGTNAITQADNDPIADAPLNLVQNSNIAVDGSGGTQDGTIYVVTGTAATARVEAFSATGEWLYQLKVNGATVAIPAIAVSQEGETAGQIAAFANNPFFGGIPSSATFRPSATPGEHPELIRSSLATGPPPAVAYFAKGGNEVHSFANVAAAGNATRNRWGPAALSQLGPVLSMANNVLNFSVADIAPTDEDYVWLVRTNHGGTSDRSLALLELGDDNSMTVRDRFALGAPLGTGLLQLPGGLIYAADPAGRVLMYEPTVAADVDLVDPAWDGANGATFKARVNPRGSTIDTCRFEVSNSQFFILPTTYVCADLPLSGSTEVISEAPAAGLVNGTTYYFRLRLSATDGTAYASQLRSWQMPVVPNLPNQVETLEVGAQNAAESSAVLGGLMNPNGTPATFYIEYSTEPDLSGSEIYPPGKDAAAGSGSSQIRVNTVVPGLEPDTEYHYRLVAKTAGGEVPAAGPPQSFRTLPPPPADPGACGNAQFRTGASARLPGCMAFERVTPADTNGADAFPISNVTDADGDTAVYAATGVFAGAPSMGISGQYRAVRDPETGWHSTGIDPVVLAPGADQGNYYSYDAINPSLTAAFGAPRNTSLGEHKINWGAKLADLTTGGVSNLARFGFSEPDEGIRVVTNRNEDFVISEDGSEAVFFDYRPILVDHGPAGPVTNVTQPSMFWYSREGGVRLASVDPNGEPLVNSVTSNWTVLLSPDAEYAVVTMAASYSGSTPEVYVLRKGESGSDWISRNRTVAPDGPPAIPATAATGTTLLGWSKDLRYLFLRSQTPIISGVDPGDVYVYDVLEDDFDVIDLVDDSSVPGLRSPQVSQGFGSKTFYFESQGNFTPNATGGGWKIYGWREGQPLRLIFQLTAVGGVERAHFQASLSGRYLAFRANPDDTAISHGGNLMVYRYDWDRDLIDCASCSPHGDASVSHADLSVDMNEFRGQVGSVSRFGERPRMLDDGRIVFNTKQRLVPEDRDDGRDVYLWDGAPKLISSGTAGFVEVSETMTRDGSSIFLHTTAQLVPADDDDKADLYVAREGGGLAMQQVRPDRSEPTCTNDCQGAGSGSPDRQHLRSRAASGDPAPAPAARRARAVVGRAKLSRTGVVRLRVRTSGAGQVVVRGKGLRSTRRRARAGRVTLVSVRLSRAAARRVARRGSFRTRAVVRFRAASGGSVARSVPVAFKRAPGVKRGGAK